MTAIQPNSVEFWAASPLTGATDRLRGSGRERFLHCGSRGSQRRSRRDHLRCRSRAGASKLSVDNAITARKTIRAITGRLIPRAGPPSPREAATPDRTGRMA
jgi:hypothetical protein